MAVPLAAERDAEGDHVVSALTLSIADEVQTIINNPPAMNR